MNTTRTRRSGFTLVEIAVVLGIALIISSITFGAFRSVSDGNKRTNCQSNLSQIYQSSRLYAQDYNGKFPYFYPDPTAYGTTPPPPPPNVNNRGMGLWALYTYRDESSNDCANSPYSPNLPLVDTEPSTLSGYVRSPKIFHCPSDDYRRDIRYRATPAATTCSTANVLSSQLNFTVDGVVRKNPSYLSYQNQGESGTSLSIAPHDTYTSYRGEGIKRQLTYYNAGTVVERPMDDTTVITWCRFHRSLDRTGSTTNPSRRNYDNVLFADGSVQNLPAEQPVIQPTPVPTPPPDPKCYGWQRVPRGRADFMKNASTCTP